MKKTTIKMLRKMIKVVVAITALLLAQFAYAADSPATKYIEEVTASVITVSPQELSDLLDDKWVEEVLLDVRSAGERSQTKTILGDKEIHIPRGFLEMKGWKKIPKDQPVIVYCSLGSRSKLAVKTLQDMGWTNVRSLEGGIAAWYKSKDEDCGCLPENDEMKAEQATSEKEEASGGCKP